MQQYTLLSPQAQQVIKSHAQVQVFKPGEKFLEVGDIAHKIGFINSGIFRFFFYNAQGNEITSAFMVANEYVANIKSFFEYTPSTGAIQAETDAQVIIIERKTWEMLCQQITSWESAIHQIKEEHLVRKIKFQRSIIQEDAKSSYLNFIARYPSVVQTVKLKHIASFLGITQHSLSRIRKQIIEEVHFLPNDKKQG